MLTAACLDSLPARAFHRVTLRLALEQWGRVDSTARRTIQRANAHAAEILRRRVALGRDSIVAADGQLSWRDVLASPSVAWIELRGGRAEWFPATGVTPQLLAFIKPAVDDLVSPASGLGAIRSDGVNPVRFGVELAGSTVLDSVGPPPADPTRPERGLPVFTLPVPWQSRAVVVAPGPATTYPRLALQEEATALLRFDVVVDTAGRVVRDEIALVADELSRSFVGKDTVEQRARMLAAFVDAAKPTIAGRRFTPPRIAGCVTARRLAQRIQFVMPR